MNAKLKQKSAHALLLVFILVSILFLKPDATVDHDTGFVSSKLEVKETVEKNVTSTSYVNSEDTVTDAIDMGYATVQRTRNSAGQVTEEFYLDAAGNPVERYGDYYGISYKYNSESVVIKYLGADKKPMMLGVGYSAIVRALVDGKATDDFYYDLNMQPVQCTGGYYGLHREYDEQGQNCGIIYLGENEQPVICTSGYAVKTYLRDSDGTVIGERYFDTERKPVKSSLGQYGKLYQRDEQGHISQITYLGADGNPMALSKGQYGIKRSGKVNLLLDKNGHVMLCVDNILNGFPFMVVISGCVICLLILLLPKKMSIFLTAVYVAFILYETLMFRESGDARTNFVLFSYADRFLTEQSVRVGVVNNIWLFAPLGTGLYKLFQKKWVLVIPFVMSVAIETTQSITGLGIAEFDDVFGNTVGGRQHMCKEDRAMEHYTRMTEKGVSVDAPKVTTQEQRKAILNAVIWKYDWIQQNKKRCFRFAEVIIARQKNGGTKNLQESRFVEDFIQYAAALPEPNRRVLDMMYEAAWHIICIYRLGMTRDQVPEPWYDTVSEVRKNSARSTQMGNVEYAECYAELANAIILQAFKDYRKALFKLVQEPKNGNTGPAKRNWSDSSTRSGIAP